MGEKTLLVHLNRIAASTSIDEAWDLATGHFARLGFKRANYGYTRFRHLKTIGDPDDALFLTTCDAEFVRRYFAGGFFAKTPVLSTATMDILTECVLGVAASHSTSTNRSLS